MDAEQSVEEDAVGGVAWRSPFIPARRHLSFAKDFNPNECATTTAAASSMPPQGKAVMTLQL